MHKIEKPYFRLILRFEFRTRHQDHVIELYFDMKLTGSKQLPGMINTNHNSIFHLKNDTQSIKIAYNYGNVLFVYPKRTPTSLAH